jgi:hypothetical protein
MLKYTLFRMLLSLCHPDLGKVSQPTPADLILVLFRGATALALHTEHIDIQ